MVGEAISGSTIFDCAAMNSKVGGTAGGGWGTPEISHGRIVGSNSGSISSNLAFSGMLNRNNNINGSEIGVVAKSQPLSIFKTITVSYSEWNGVKGGIY